MFAAPRPSSSPDDSCRAGPAYNNFAPAIPSPPSVHITPISWKNKARIEFAFRCEERRSRCARWRTRCATVQVESSSLVALCQNAGFQ
jgi:hypothetical protein